jgi:NAD(P)-dependent dehydrogenase (short-subunit alcohol dehydrogenase family)
MTQTVFITGADKGLGFALTERFLTEGGRVFAGQYETDTNLGPLSSVHPDRLTVVPLDITDLDSVSEAAKIVAEHTDALDILINNAGVHLEPEDARLEALDLDDGHLQASMDVNAFGSLRVNQQFLPLLRKGEGKLIVHISSEAGSIADCTRRSWFAYCMSKTALNMQCKILQNYLGPEGFKVLALHPGWMQTDMGSPDADFPPEVPAQAIYELTRRDWSPSGPIYMNYDGSLRPW